MDRLQRREGVDDWSPALCQLGRWIDDNGEFDERALLVRTDNRTEEQKASATTVHLQNRRNARQRVADGAIARVTLDRRAAEHARRWIRLVRVGEDRGGSVVEVGESRPARSEESARY